MLARYVRRIARRDGAVVLTLSCGHQVFMGAVDYFERTLTQGELVTCVNGRCVFGPPRSFVPTCWECAECWAERATDAAIGDSDAAGEGV